MRKKRKNRIKIFGMFLIIAVAAAAGYIVHIRQMPSGMLQAKGRYHQVNKTAETDNSAQGEIQNTAQETQETKESQAAEQLRQLYAQAAVLIDGDSGRVLFGKNENDVMPMASTTKIMTCILALENTDMQDVAVVSDYAASMPEVSLGLKAGQTCRIEELLYAMMLESYNDAAVVIAEHVAGSVEAFAQMMNDKAKKIGCTDTFFVTPNGLDGETQTENGETHIHATTAKELALILRYCMKVSDKRETFIAITTTQNRQFTDTKGEMSKSLVNRNAFLRMMQGASSGKTGFTGKAGYCYVGSVVDNDRTYIVALLACGWPNNKTYKWRDMEKLINYGKENFKKRKISTALELQPVKVLEAVAEPGRLHDISYLPVAVDTSVYDEPLCILASDAEEIQTELNIVHEVAAPVSEGQLAGTVIFRLNDMKLREYPVIFTEGAEAISMEWCVRQIAERFLDP